MNVLPIQLSTTAVSKISSNRQQARIRFSSSHEINAEKHRIFRFAKIDKLTKTRTFTSSTIISKPYIKPLVKGLPHRPPKQIISPPADKLFAKFSLTQSFFVSLQ